MSNNPQHMVCILHRYLIKILKNRSKIFHRSSVNFLKGESIAPDRLILLYSFFLMKIWISRQNIKIVGQIFRMKMQVTDQAQYF